jgi:hypothetical protein
MVILSHIKGSWSIRQKYEFEEAPGNLNEWSIAAYYVHPKSAGIARKLLNWLKGFDFPD